MSSFSQGLQSELLSLGRDIQKETFEECNRMIKGSGKRRQDRCKRPNTVLFFKG